MFTDREFEARIHNLMTYNLSNDHCKLTEYSVYDFQKAETVQHKGCLFVI